MSHFVHLVSHALHGSSPSLVTCYPCTCAFLLEFDFLFFHIDLSFLVFSLHFEYVCSGRKGPKLGLSQVWWSVCLFLGQAWHASRRMSPQGHRELRSASICALMFRFRLNVVVFRAEVGRGSRWFIVLIRCNGVAQVVLSWERWCTRQRGFTLVP